MSIKNANCLSAKGLHKQYGSRMVVNDVDISVNRNEVVGLLGPNGAGKNSLFSILAGVSKPSMGEVLYDSKIVNNLSF